MCPKKTSARYPSATAEAICGRGLFWALELVTGWVPWEKVQLEGPGVYVPQNSVWLNQNARRDWWAMD